MRTGEISFRLRTWAERIRKTNKAKYELLTNAADRLDDLDERVAIMTEHSYPVNGDYTFPPDDDELKEGDSN